MTASARKYGNVAVEKRSDGPVETYPLRTSKSIAVQGSRNSSINATLERTGGDLRRAVALVSHALNGENRQAPSGFFFGTPARSRAAAARSLSGDMALQPGEEIGSDSGNAKFIYQEDGNLVLYVRRDGDLPSTSPASAWVPRWASNTAGQAAGTCVMQSDGNLVIYLPDGTPIWASNTWGNPGASLFVQDDENVVIYGDGGALWSTNTWIGGIVRSGFDPRTHGFKFVNSFADGYWQFGFLRFSTAGLCGGMSFSALDYYFSGATIPSQVTTPSAVNDPLGQYINARQQESVTSNLGGWAVQILNPDDHALNYWATHDEWTKLTATINAGVPAPLGLGIYLNGGASHQVVAVGYREGAQERWILTYDPNSPSTEGYVYLAPANLHWRDHLGGDWRGLFVSSYTPRAP